MKTAESAAERKRTEIIQAAFKVFSEKGYHPTRVADITTELGIGYGLFYHYFQNKLDIFSQIIDRLIERIKEEVVSEIEVIPDTREEFLDQIKRVGDRLGDIFVEDPNISKFIFYEALGIDEEINRKIQDTFELFTQYTKKYLEKGMEKGFLRRDILVYETAQAINAMILQGARYTMQAEDKPEAAQRWHEALVGMMLHGLENPDN
jgi:AcrR family transcriptional regulator